MSSIGHAFIAAGLTIGALTIANKFVDAANDQPRKSSQNPTVEPASADICKNLSRSIETLVQQAKAQGANAAVPSVSCDFPASKSPQPTP